MSAAKDRIVELSREIAERVAASEGLEIVEVEWRGVGRGVLRVFIDKPGGVGLDDCEAVSKQMSTILDIEEVVPGGAYSLEVSSPGLDRKLVKRGDYERFAGRRATLRFSAPIEGRQQATGVLTGIEGDEVLLEIGAKTPLRAPLESIRTARLVVEI